MWFPHLLFSAVLGLSLASAAPAHEPRPLMRDFIGLNGHTVQFKPDLYRPVSGVVRDYHPVEWDLGKETGVLPKFPFAKNGVDWQQVYGSWREKKWDISACLMFESVKREDWKDLDADARAYGEAFARELGPSGNRKLVDSVEIGNEPGKWSDADYTSIFKAMATGIRAGDPKLKIATCNLTTGKGGDYEKSIDCVAAFPDLFDVLNVHTYAQHEGWPTWKRSFPEDPKLPNYLQDVEKLCKWRDTHTPAKPIWITEFGYDSTTQPNSPTGDFAKWQGVTDTQQAQWLVRSLLVFSSMPVQRAYVFFFNDEDQPGLHASAGLTRHFKPKPSFHALAHLQQVLGDCRFEKIVTNEPAQLRVQEYRNDAGKIVWAVWSPTGEGKKFTATLDNLPGKIEDMLQMPMSSESPASPAIPEVEDDKLVIEVKESPAYLFFKKH